MWRGSGEQIKRKLLHGLKENARKSKQKKHQYQNNQNNQN